MAGRHGRLAAAGTGAPADDAGARGAAAARGNHTDPGRHHARHAAAVRDADTDRHAGGDADARRGGLRELRRDGAAAGAAGAGGTGAGWSQTGAASAETADQMYARVTGEHRTFGIGDAIGRGWELVSGNLGLAVGATAIWILCTAAGAIPCLGILISLGVTPILQAGLYRLFLKLHRGEPAEFGDVFSTFSTSYLQVFLYALVQLILIGICLVPGYALSMIGSILSQRNEAIGMLLSFIGVLLVFPPAVYLTVSWVFAPLLIVDKGLDFWPAMELSRKVVAKQFFGVLGLLFICGLIFLAGIVALCLGVFVARRWPWRRSPWPTTALRPRR